MTRTVVAAALAAASSAPAAPLEDLVSESRLDNGLTLLVVENSESPTIGLVTAFSVGSAEERPGVGGVSHILEHMLFKGTTEVGTTDWPAEKVHHERIEELTARARAAQTMGDVQEAERLLAERTREQEAAKGYAVDNELWGLYEGAGGTDLNAFTSYDITAYHLALPSNRLELWMYLESERLREPVLRQFYTEIQNVMEERRLATDANPQGILQEGFLSVAFDAHWYGQPIIGWPSDIQSLTRTEAEDWFRTYYAPNRMTLAVVGDVDAKRVRALVEDYFGDIPAHAPPEPMETFDLEKQGARRIEVEYDAEPRLMMGWHKSTLPHADDAALHVVSEVLTGGRSSRLRKILVEERQVAASIASDHAYPGIRWDNLFLVDALPRSPHTAADLEGAIREELDRLAREGISERELAKAKRRIRAGEIRDLKSNHGLAVELAYAQAAFGDWRVILEASRAVRAVTVENVRDVAQRTFRPGRTVTATLVSPAFEADPERTRLGEGVVARMVEALGGEEALGAIESAVVSSQVSLETPGGALQAEVRTAYLLPDRVRSEMKLFGQTAVQCVSPGGVWSSRPGGVTDLGGEEARERRADLERDVFLLAYPALSGGFVLQGLGQKEGLDVVEVRGSTGRPFTASFDPETGLPVRVLYEGTHPMTGKAARFVEAFEDFRAVDGVSRAHRTVTSIDGEVFAASTVREIQWNAALQDEEFVRPEGQE